MSVGGALICGLCVYTEEYGITFLQEMPIITVNLLFAEDPPKLGWGCTYLWSVHLYRGIRYYIFARHAYNYHLSLVYRGLETLSQWSEG